MNLRELEAQAEALAPVIAAAVRKAVAPLMEAMAERDELIKELIKERELEKAELPDLAAIAALVEVPVPKDGEPGKDAEPVDLEALAKAAAALIVLPEVKDGKDADPVDLEAVAALVKVPEVEKVDVDAIARAAAELIPVPAILEPQHGRDAIDLEILPAIDETKQYPRGTYAAHRGGLWKSYERTHAMRGWECIVEGIDAVNVVQNGDREFSVTMVKSSGAEVVQKFALPIQIYKGVYRDDEAYEAHDNVTWGGSQWTSTKAANTDKPGSSDAWVLCVKAGRPGKDLRENASTFDASKGVMLK
jgi:hypothetical protein